MYLLAELPAAQCCSFITIRTRAPASPALAAEIRQVTARMPGIDPGRALTPRLVTERHAPIMRPWQLSGEIFAVFAALALAAAAAGIYGLIAYDVAQRSQEFGVRAALGASRRNLLQLVVFDGVRTSLSGVAIGIVMAIVVGRLTAALLFDTQPHDPAALAVSAIILVVVSGAASFVPAWRAASISPTVALKGQG
jgi:ABC-type lipoprotein release transport system permease subunit